MRDWANNRRPRTWLAAMALLVSGACGGDGDTPSTGEPAAGTAFAPSPPPAGDGDGTSMPGPGDPGPGVGDGDGMATPGEGDGMATPGDGDGMAMPGDGDGVGMPGDGDGVGMPGDGDGVGMPGDGDGMGMPGDGDGDGGGMATPGDWGEQDATADGPFETTTETGTGPDGAFTMFRPATPTGRHPVITWGNGTGASPQSYGRMLARYASHGFIVIASDSPNVAQGNPPPMIQGITWVLEQDMDSTSPLYEHVDREHIGATGHSQGAFATSAAGADMRITATAPIQGARSGTLHGPSLLLCGGMDEIVPCTGSERAFGSISVPVMYANLLAADHIAWIREGANSQYSIVTTAWFRLHLMGDESQRSMFYGDDCTLCQDPAWEVQQKLE